MDAIDAWEHDKVSTLPFYWNKDVDSSDMSHMTHVNEHNVRLSDKARVEHVETISGLSALPGLKLSHGWFKRAVWHVRSRSRI